MKVTIVGRHSNIDNKLREYIEEKVSKVEQLYPRADSVNVEVTHENNPRRVNTSEKVEFTVLGKGPIIRAEATSFDKYAAVDIAIGKLFERLRRMRDKAKDHRRYESVSFNIQGIVDEIKIPEKEKAEEKTVKTPADLKPGEYIEEQVGDSPVTIRQKVYEASQMTVDEALDQMELVGHPFFLFIDKETKQPCAVYHRHGWTYGVIRLDTTVVE
ncbi:ribosome-associated translation inhibitor RaiA [Actinomyces sp. zg-332]|uniref:ribosome hibernation-promoting factor, HPF/YfiA family n=1 Tax=Actinomyces sp. zg-332 TaxID=2708340 RepID=UPI0014238AFE|nr:ribosome-associated translation inhibitor RaiA [Actinomyces sp. zg-332]QPK94633.1 ribosome-associated translation inhibitor RaiA [Actinomyces sp. zg-332]